MSRGGAGKSKKGSKFGSLEVEVISQQRDLGGRNRHPKEVERSHTNGLLVDRSSLQRRKPRRVIFGQRTEDPCNGDQPFRSVTEETSQKECHLEKSQRESQGKIRQREVAAEMRLRQGRAWG